MAPSISHTVESESQITPASLKAAFSPEEVHHDTPAEVTQEPTLVDPLATTTSVPSSDDDMDEDISIDGTADNVSDTGADVTPAVVTVATAEIVAAETTEVVAAETTDDATTEETTQSPEEELVAVATSFAEGFSLEDRTEAAISPPQPPAAIEQVQTSNDSVPSPSPLASASTPVTSPTTTESKEDNEVALIAAAAAVVAQEGEVARKPLSRPLSRQELRRKSSLFNSNEKTR
ncbi:hypothetical protein BGZ95_005316 [Linnemannia exigua]|uniref:Uncharacterized protein n=1 Tax=Linnemannia exigua TaxID=604196 RepID=A0AAD4D3Q3_9FUNG|nr:hypothetical protein BGZ95_005316 [Linnemannia exigua]